MTRLLVETPPLQSGVEWVETSPTAADTLQALLDEAHRFFAQSVDAKSALRASTGTLTGWRAIGVEYSQSPDRPDQNETFCFRGADDRYGELPSTPLIERCRAAHNALDAIANLTLDNLARSLGVLTPSPAVRTRFESWLQINFSTPATVEKPFIQESHEDGHLVTFLFADADGLEIKPVGEPWTPILPTPHKLVCFPGECGALLTGDALVPMPHLVRSRRDVPVRISVAYFVNPDLDQTLNPWVFNDRNQTADLLRWGQENPARFGLPTLQ